MYYDLSDLGQEGHCFFIEVSLPAGKSSTGVTKSHGAITDAEIPSTLSFMPDSHIRHSDPKPQADLPRDTMQSVFTGVQAPSIASNY
jgi:hypothetical protein